MTKVEYWECDRCGKKILKLTDMAFVIFIGKQKELCKNCQEEFKKWFKQGQKNRANKLNRIRNNALSTKGEAQGEKE